MEGKLDLEGEYSVYRGTFDSLVIKVILGSFGAFPIFDNPVS